MYIYCVVILTSRNTQNDDTEQGCRRPFTTMLEACCTSQGREWQVLRLQVGSHRSTTKCNVRLKMPQTPLGGLLSLFQIPQLTVEGLRECPSSFPTPFDAYSTWPLHPPWNFFSVGAYKYRCHLEELWYLHLIKTRGVSRISSWGGGRKVSWSRRLRPPEAEAFCV